MGSNPATPTAVRPGQGPDPLSGSGPRFVPWAICRAVEAQASEAMRQVSCLIEIKQNFMDQLRALRAKGGFAPDRGRLDLVSDAHSEGCRRPLLSDAPGRQSGRGEARRAGNPATVVLLTRIGEGRGPATSDSPELAATAHALKEGGLVTTPKQSGGRQAESPMTDVSTWSTATTRTVQGSGNAGICSTPRSGDGTHGPARPQQPAPRSLSLGDRPTLAAEQTDSRSMPLSPCPAA